MIKLDKQSFNCPAALEKMFSEKGGMIYTNIYPPKKLSINNVFLPSPEKQDLSDFLSQWYLKYKQIKTKNNRCFFLQRSYSFVLSFS